VRFSAGGCPFYCSLIAVLYLGAQPLTASAHNVVSGIYTDGMTIEGEIGFSNGDMAQAGSPVKVYDSEGDLLTELTLTTGGVFSYEAKTVSRHVFKANLSAGHIAEMVVEADELTELAPPKAESTPLEALAKSSITLNLKDPAKPQVSAASAESNSQLATGDSKLENNITVEQLESIVRSAVAQQIRPLQKELRAYKEKVMFRDIAGGLGFIFGLFGVAAWVASKRKQGDKNATVS